MGHGQSGTSLYLFAGVHDGSTGSTRTSGSVPFTHSVRLFNLLAEYAGRTDQRVNDATMLRLTELRTGPDTAQHLNLGGRPVHLYRSAGSAHLAIFEGEHEMLTGSTIKLIRANYAGMGHS
jgi:hypothetical protein